MAVAIKANEIQALAKVLAAFRNEWKLERKVRELGDGRPDKYLAQLLWAAFREGLPVAEETNILLPLFRGAPKAWDAGDLLRLIREMDRHFPNAVSARGGWGGDGELPGGPDGLRALIEERRGDPDFVAAMRAGYRDLPDPWRVGVGYYLAAFGYMPHDEIPEADRRRVALAHLRCGKGTYHIWTRPHAFPPEVWGPLLVRVAAEEPDLVFTKPEVLGDLIPHATAAQVVAAIAHCQHNWSTPDAVKALDALDASALDAFEAALPALTVGPWPPDPTQSSSEGAWPHALYALSYLRRCRREKRVPPPALDAYIGAVLDHFRQPWSGSGVEEYHGMWCDALAAIPLDRLEPLVLGTRAWNWWWATACPTPRVLSELTRQIAALPAKPDYNQKRLIEELMGAPSNCDFDKGMLRPVRKALAPYALSALRAKDPAPQRHVFVWVLAESKRAEAVQGLALALGDASKAVREMARKALTARGPDATLAALGEALASKRKDTRAEAVSVLSAFAPHAGVRALAAERAGKEKDAKVRAALKALAAKKGRSG